MIGIINTKLGNISAIQNIYYELGINCGVVSKSDEIDNIKKLIIPGIGSFDSIIDYLNDNHMFRRINDFVINEKKPILGICIGMHIFYEYSEEGNNKGFGWIKDRIIRLNSKNMRYPHMGWNSIFKVKDNNLFKNIEDNHYFYFLHNYGNLLGSKQNFVTTFSNYGDNLVSSINYKNIYGVQFHPEKSHTDGTILLNNFAKYCD